MRPHRRQSIRLFCPWDSPGKNTGRGCHFLLQCMKVKSESEVSQSCLTLSNPMDCSLPVSSIHGIFQARVLKWGAIAFSVIDLKPLFFRAPKSLQMVIAAMKLKDVYSLEGKLDQPAAAKLFQSCPTLCNPMDCSLPGFSNHGIFQARVLEWGAIAFFNYLPNQGSNLHPLHWKAKP